MEKQNKFVCAGLNWLIISISYQKNRYKIVMFIVFYTKIISQLYKGNVRDIFFLKINN